MADGRLRGRLEQEIALWEFERLSAEILDHTIQRDDLAWTRSWTLLQLFQLPPHVSDLTIAPFLGSGDLRPGADRKGQLRAAIHRSLERLEDRDHAVVV